jgi:hypothetical protein
MVKVVNGYKTKLGDGVRVNPYPSGAINVVGTCPCCGESFNTEDKNAKDFNLILIF